MQTNMEINTKYEETLTPTSAEVQGLVATSRSYTPHLYSTVQYSTVHYSTVHAAPVLQRNVGLVVAGHHRPHHRVVPAQLVQQHLRLALTALQILADLQIFLEYIFPRVNFSRPPGP